MVATGVFYSSGDYSCDHHITWETEKAPLFHWVYQEKLNFHFNKIIITHEKSRCIWVKFKDFHKLHMSLKLSNDGNMHRLKSYPTEGISVFYNNFSRGILHITVLTQ